MVLWRLGELWLVRVLAQTNLGSVGWLILSPYQYPGIFAFANYGNLLTRNLGRFEVAISIQSHGLDLRARERLKYIL